MPVGDAGAIASPPSLGDVVGRSTFRREDPYVADRPLEIAIRKEVAAPDERRGPFHDGRQPVEGTIRVRPHSPDIGRRGRHTSGLRHTIEIHDGNREIVPSAPTVTRPRRSPQRVADDHHTGAPRPPRTGRGIARSTTATTATRSSEPSADRPLTSRSGTSTAQPPKTLTEQPSTSITHTLRDDPTPTTSSEEHLPVQHLTHTEQISDRTTQDRRSSPDPTVPRVLTTQRRTTLATRTTTTATTPRRLDRVRTTVLSDTADHDAVPGPHTTEVPALLIMLTTVLTPRPTTSRSTRRTPLLRP